MSKKMKNSPGNICNNQSNFCGGVELSLQPLLTRCVPTRCCLSAQAAALALTTISRQQLSTNICWLETVSLNLLGLFQLPLPRVASEAQPDCVVFRSHLRIVRKHNHCALALGALRWRSSSSWLGKCFKTRCGCTGSAK